MRIALFGGTFNPVHNGHLENARFVADEFELDQVFFIPSRMPVHKNIHDDPGPSERALMVGKAVSLDHRFHLSTIELDRETPSYMVYTVREFRKQFPHADLFFILGVDSLNTLFSWREFEELLISLHFIVMKRPNEQISSEIVKQIPQLSVSKNSLIDISSTDIRHKIKAKKNCRELLPADVLSYIIEKGFYSH
ncbi:MAG: nicotinate-nucleotide adenylyltransferase [Spirochaetes bacterium]|jgi:nicotinate-nucleotide adenylyltransferase|nr:nicotinate-nucleotide adenylyltransferase [Spirochaetota bacterium]